MDRQRENSYDSMKLTSKDAIQAVEKAQWHYRLSSRDIAHQALEGVVGKVSCHALRRL